MTPTLRRLLLTTAAVTLVAAAPASAQTPLKASFTADPEQPALGQAVQLTATSTGSGLTPITHAWDLDGDGAFDDATGDKATTTFATAGTHVVRLRASRAATVTQTDVAEKTFTVAEPTPAPTSTPTPTPEAAPTPAPPGPEARFDRQCSRHGRYVFCALGIAYQRQTKRISAAPSTGQIVKYEWDLDGNGDFETSTGATSFVEHVFEPRMLGVKAVREWTVSVRVTDAAGATSTGGFKLTIKPPKCQKQAKVGAFTATGACLRDWGSHWRSTEPLTLNGVAIQPRDGHFVRLSEDSISSRRAFVSMNAGGTHAVLSSNSFRWRPSGSELRDFEVDAAAKVNGLKVTGLQGRPALSGGALRAKAFLALPEQFGGATSGTPVTLGGGAQAASGAFSFTVPSAALGPIGLDKLVVSYDGVDLWEIEAGVVLPPPAFVNVSGKAGIRNDGRFAYAQGETTFPGGIALGSTGVFLERIKFRIEVDPPESECVPQVGVKPVYWPEFLGPRPSNVPSHVDFGVPTFAMCGEVSLTAGPSVGGVAAARLTAGLGWATYADRPWVLRAFGDLYLVNHKMASAALSVHGDGYILASGDFSIGWSGVASISGGVRLEMLKSKFNATGRVDACLEFVDWCARARAIVSNKGIAACLKIDVLVGYWTPGIGYEWGDALPTPYFDGCDIGDYKVKISRPQAAAAQFTGAARTIDIGPGLPGTALVIKGQGAPPRVTITGPGGRTITPPTDGRKVSEGSGAFLMEDPRTQTTQVLISQPAAGRWTITPQPGSVPITEVLAADGLPEPEVSVKVKRAGELRYKVKPVAGQKVTIVERGGTAGGEIGVAKGAEGVLRWTPAEGAAEKRQIVALVEQDGQLRDEITLGSYRAPKAARPAKVRGVKVTRTGVRWQRVRGAGSYVVAAKLPGGRTVVKSVRAPRLAVRGATRVTVRAVSPSGITGPRTAARRP